MPRNKLPGRPSKLTELLIANVEDLVRRGNAYCVVASIVGISYDSFRGWMVKGEEEFNEYPHGTDIPEEEMSMYLKFFLAVKRAESAGEASLVDIIRGDDSWQSKAWLLERRHPSRWGKQQQINANITANTTNTNVNLDLANVPVEEIDRQLAILERLEQDRNKQ